MFAWFGKVNFSPYTKVGEFADHLKNGRLKGSRCRKCGQRSFPPRADCGECLSGDFEFVDVSGRGKLFTFTRITAAPGGFEDLVPYTIGVVDLEDGGRCLAWFGSSVREEEIRIGMPLQVVPRINEELERIQVYCTLEKR